MLGFLIQFIEWTYYYFWKEHREIEPASSSETVDLSGSSQRHPTSSNPQEDNIEESQTGQMSGSKGAQTEAGPSNAPVTPPAPIPERVVLLYAFGALQPMLAIPEKKPVTKYSLCSSFNQSNDQIVYIFRDATLIHMFPGGEDSNVTIRPSGSYFVIFQDDVAWYGGLHAIKVQQTLMVEMMEFETKKGDLKNPSNYPNIANILRDLEKFTDRNEMEEIKKIKPIPEYYKVGGLEPALQGLQRTQKIILCALFGESIYQHVKIYYNGNHHQTLANCFDMVETTEPGKYVIIFESDSIHSLSNKEIEHELKNFELELAEQKKQQKKKVEALKETSVVPVEAKNSPADPGGEIRLYGYGDIKPTQILSKNGKYTKRYICSLFGQQFVQEVQIYGDLLNGHTFPEGDGDVFLDYGSYTVIFQSKDITNEIVRILIPFNIAAMKEALKFEKEKGDLCCKRTYPIINAIFEEIEEGTDSLGGGDEPDQVFYCVGSVLPMLPGRKSVMKLILCVLYKQSIYQEIKIFRNNKLHSTVSNNFEYVRATEPGDYVVVFESDAIYSMPTAQAEQELKRIKQDLEQLLQSAELLRTDRDPDIELVFEEEKKGKNSEEENMRNAEINSTPSPKREIELYGYGDAKPTHIIAEKPTLNKKVNISLAFLIIFQYICSVFRQQLAQEVYIFRGAQLVHTFAYDDENRDILLVYTAYTVVFQNQLGEDEDADDANYYLAMLDEKIRDGERFESDAIYSMPTAAAEEELKRIEQQLLAEKTKKKTESAAIKPVPETELRLYGYGEIEPALVDKQKSATTKKLICTVFDQLLPQEVHIYRGAKRIHKFDAHDDNGNVSLGYGSYEIVFQDKIRQFEGLNNIENYLRMKEEMDKFEATKGDLRCQKTYPTLNQFLIPLRQHLKEWYDRDDPHPAFYGVGAKLPALRSIESVMKIVLCAIFNQSIYQKLKIFHNRRYYTTMSNCFESVFTPKAGKYVVVFENDKIYSMPTAEAEKQLERIDQQLLQEQEQEKKALLVEKREKKTKAEGRKTTVSKPQSEEEVHLYGYGDIKPTRILSESRKLTKKFICSIFGQQLSQEIYIFKGPDAFFKFSAHDKDSFAVLFKSGSYTVVFQRKDIKGNEDIEDIQVRIVLVDELIKYETEKGDLRDEENYPATSILLQKVDEDLKKLTGTNHGFYGIGDFHPSLPHVSPVSKIALCAVFQQSIYHEIKLYYNNKFYCTVSSNCFTNATTSRPGKYVVVFEDDITFDWPTAKVEQELERIERKLSNGLDQRVEDIQPSVSSLSNSEKNVFLYGYGCLEPKCTLQTEELIDKYLLCTAFKQRFDQLVLIFNKDTVVKTFSAEGNDYVQFGEQGQFTIVFEEEIRKIELHRVQVYLSLLDEMRQWEKHKKGSLRSQQYPLSYDVILNVESLAQRYGRMIKPGICIPSIYGIGASQPTISGYTEINKMIICMMFNKSIGLDVKVFHENRPYAILSNCLTHIKVPNSGRCVVVFQTDALYNKTDDEIGEELRRCDPHVIASKSVDELAEEFRIMDEEKKKKTEKNNKKKAKKKEKKLLQQQQEIDSNPSELGQQSSKSEAPAPDEPEAGRQGNDSAMQAPTTKKKKGKKQKKKSNTNEEPAKELDQVSDSEEPAVSVENRFSSLQFLEKLLPKSADVLKGVEPVVAKKLSTVPQIEPSLLEGSSKSPMIDGNEATSSGFQECQDGIDDQLQKVLAESIPFEKPKIYARNKNKSFSSEPSSKDGKTTNWKTHPSQKSPFIDPEPSTSSASYADEATCSRSSYTQDSDSCTEDESSMFEEIAIRPLTDSHRGAKAVVVGIFARGLIVQTLAPTEAESEFLLLDYCSQCTSSGRSLTDVGFDVKVLHVFLKVISVATLGNEPIINENLTQKGRKIEKRVATYALDDDTWTRGRFKRGYRDAIDDELHLNKKEKKTIALIVETDEEDKADIVRVVGPPSHLSFLAQLDKTRMRDEYSPLTQNIYFQREEFIMADSFQADPFFKLNLMFDTLCLVKSYQAEENFKQLAKKLANMHLELQKCLRAEETNYDSILLKNFPHTSDPPNGDTFLFNIEKLDTKQGYLIETCCKELAMKAEKLKKKGKKKGSPDDMDQDYDPDELFNQFRLFLRDPALSICRFNSYYALRNAQLYTIKTKARLTIERAELCIVIELNHAQVFQVLPSHEKAVGRNKNSWIEGGQLKLVNPVLRRQRQTHFGMQMKSDADLVIDEIRQYREPVVYVGQNGEPFETMERRARIRLMPAKNSKDIFDIIQEFPSSAQDFAKEFSQIGPAARDGASETLATGLLKFDKFYNNQRFFNWWRGYRDAESPENVDYLNFLQDEIEIPNGRDPTKPFILDGSQSLAYQHAFYRDGITSIAAGPGSGKTLLSAGLIIKCHKDRMDERMIVTATTNEGVDNAVEKIVQLSPGFPATREMGKKGEMTVREEIKEHTLRYQALESEQTHPVLLKVRKEYRNVLKYFNAAKNLRDKLNRLELLHYAESKVKRTYLRTVVPFCGASTPALLVRHADHYNVVINDEDERTHRKWPIKHMIVDEASQLPYYTSLALCCSFPYLERITVMGDRKQLGPHCVLQSHSGLLSQLCRLSELDRINGLVTVEEFYLRMNYRSHLWIVENLEQPHYGPDFQSGLAPGARTLAYTLDLPLFKIRSKATVRPVAFINIAPGDDCQNASEREGVLKLLEKLMEKGASPAGISILCFHRKQKEELEKCLKPRFTSFKMREFVSKLGDVHTIDSFQGRENDIIIVCTTKTVGDEGSFHRGIFSFVSDPRRGLVAVSRAKEAMYVFGQWKSLQKMSFWKDKVALMKREKLMYDESFNEM